MKRPSLAGFQAPPDNDDTASGFFAIGITSDNFDPVLAIRGTDFNQAEDWVANLNWEGIGYLQFAAVWDKEGDDPSTDAKDWLDDQLEHGSTPIVIGHSLGGALAQRIAAEYTSTWGGPDPWLAEVVTFNSPGIGEFEANEFRRGGVARDVMSCHGFQV